jgi:hypothetical protein
MMGMLLDTNLTTIKNCEKLGKMLAQAEIVNFTNLYSEINKFYKSQFPAIQRIAQRMEEQNTMLSRNNGDLLRYVENTVRPLINIISPMEHLQQLINGLRQLNERRFDQINRDIKTLFETIVENFNQPGRNIFEAIVKEIKVTVRNLFNHIRNVGMIITQNFSTLLQSQTIISEKTKQ